MRRIALVTCLLGAACASTPTADKPAPTPREEKNAPVPLTTEPPPSLPPSAPPKDTCPPIDERKLQPPTCDDSIVSAPIPNIVDDAHSLTTFYESYAALARGRANEHVRLAMYGDSNLTMDELTGRLRRDFQRRFGDGGHGFVALAIPWHWYSHQDVHHDGTWDHFKLFATSTAPAPDQQYGMAMMAAESTRQGGSVWVATADSASPIGTTASRFDVYFMKRPGAGAFELLADDKVVRTVSARSSIVELGVEHVELPDAPHKIACTVTSNAPVRFFGATLERAAPSVVVDSLGTGALNFVQIQYTSKTTRTPMLARRDYKLVMFQVGTNTFMLERHKDDVKRFLAEIRATLPSVSILLMTPPDVMKTWDAPHSDPRIVIVARQLREIAAETGVAFWDYREAMGGDTSMKTFIKKGLAAGDKVHLKKEGSEIMADRFLCAMDADFRRWVVEHPNAGCETPSSR